MTSMLAALANASPWPVLFRVPPSGTAGQAVGGKIFVAPNLTLGVKCYVLLHEICHAVAIEEGLHPSFEALMALESTEERRLAAEFAEALADLAVAEAARQLGWRIRGEHAARLARTEAAAAADARAAAAAIAGEVLNRIRPAGS